MNISDLSDHLGQFVYAQTSNRNYDLNTICYGIEIILVLLISIITITTIGAILGLFIPVFFVSISFLVMKMIIGGPHLSGFSRCVMLSALLMVGTAWFITYIELSNRSIPISTLLGIVIILCYAPQINPANQRPQRFHRKLAGSVLLLLAGCSLMLLQNALFAYCYYGLLISALSISPITTHSIRFIDKMTKGGVKS